MPITETGSIRPAHVRTRYAILVVRYSFKSSVASEMMSKPSPDETGAEWEWEGGQQ